jgi:hypothetical protein
MLFIVAACIGALALIGVLPVSDALRAALAFYVVARTFEAHARLRRFVALSLRLDGRIELEQRDGSTVQAQVRPGGVVTAWLAAVRWRAAGARFDRAILVLPDMLPEEEFRQLRVLLRWA